MAEPVESVWKPLNPSRREIRLLYLDSATNDTRVNNYQLSGRLATVSLDRPGTDCQYYAISHAWGSAQTMYPLYIDGMRLMITQSILECLDVFGGERPGAAFWIDAVCINQQDIEERAAQVQLMRYVFSQAMEVWVWLGRDLSPVRELVRCIRRADKLPSSLTDEQGKRFICQVVLFGQLEWLHRVWTIQEIVLSKDVRFWYDNIQISVPDLWSWQRKLGKVLDQAQASVLRTSDNNRLANCINIIIRLRFHQKLLLRLLSVNPEIREIEMLIVLAESRTASSSDIRDRVYGQLAIFEAALQREIVRPDYTVSVTKVFINFAFEWCRVNESLNILNQVSSSRNSLLGLPTWVPDWSSRDSFEIERRRLSTRIPYRAAGSSTLSNPDLTPDLQFRVSGLEIDDVGGLSTVREARDVPVSEEEKASLLRRIGRWKQFYHDRIKETQCPGVRCADYSCIATSFTRTMFRDVIMRDGETRMRRFSQDSEAMEALDCFQNVLSSAPYSYENSRHSAGFLSDATASSRFFVTSGGRPGLGPPDMREGDCVALLSGGNMPYILRRNRAASKSNIYSFIGECYVHDAMDGQLFDENRVHEIWME